LRSIPLVAALICLVAAPVGAQNLATHVNSFTGKDLPAPDPPDAWNKWGSVMVANLSVAQVGDFVYAASYYSGRICIFRRDPKTAKITFRGSILMPYNRKWTSAQLFGRGGLLYALYSKPKKELRWYGVDQKTGALTEKGTLAASGSPLLTPDARGLYLFSKKIHRVTFDEAGSPRGAATFESRGGSDPVVSPDGKFIYAAIRHDAGQTHGRIAIYRRQPAAGTVAWVEIFDLAGNKVSKPGATPCLGISPDGKHVYASLWRWDPGYLYVLNRDAEKGTLSVAWSGSPVPEMKAARLFRFNPHGKSGYYVAGGEGGGACTGWFRRDPATGRLAFAGKFQAGSGRYCGIVLDTENGNLFTVGFHYNAPGTVISSFKIPTTR